ncbi:DUF1428 domain-containing protein [Paraferrimonas sedimenticola]|uniref:DUF1428 domain-containing protein n=1 Tax=Paraferrimonas sedimenticola TaxID=375674 RepID=A0AA37RX16_9GAMM|nr:DUF1428 domain-containing protein [Paraferrimonas sedimenticola]GLP96232.1 hypothetical protein GCM10007895_15380 [Paraferrimonas sedimenticola]
MANYIDGFLLPIPKSGLADYQALVSEVADIWKGHGALDYREFVGDDSSLEGVRSFVDAANASADEVVIFGWVTFESRQARDEVNQKVASDLRMQALMSRFDTGFDPQRMAYAGFRPLV